MKIAIATTAAVLLTCAASAHAADLIKPEAGAWEHATQLSPDGKTWRPGHKSQGCMSAAEAAAWDQQVRQQIAQQGCTINSLSVAGGKINGVIACANVNQPVLTVSGDYSATAYAVDLSATAVVDASAVGGSARTPARSFAKWTGRRTGSC